MIKIEKTVQIEGWQIKKKIKRMYKFEKKKARKLIYNRK